MQSLWPWLAVAGAGVLHGMNPIAGWAFVACRGHREPGSGIGRALVSVAAGHVTSLLVVAAAVPAALWLGMSFNPLVAQGAAVGLLLVVAVRHFRGRRDRVTSRAGLALWTFIVGLAHGTGWMLVPALVPLCASGMPGREITASGSLVLALAAVGVHMAAMVCAFAAMGVLGRRGWRAGLAWIRAR